MNNQPPQNNDPYHTPSDPISLGSPPPALGGHGFGGPPPFTPPSPATLPGALAASPQLIEADGTHSTTVSETVVRNSSPVARFALAGLIGVAAIGGGFAARSALSEPAGPQTPEQAVTEMFAALDNEDFLGIGEVLLPSERESLVEPSLAILSELQRLEIVDANFDPAAATVFDIEVEGLTMSVEMVDPRLARVTTTGGTITSSDVAFEDLPIGDLFNNPVFDEPFAELEDETKDMQGGTLDMARDPGTFAVVEDEGSWYVSLWYSAAEEARRDAGMNFPGLGNGPTPVGAATPEGVMEDMVRAMADLDPEAMLTLVDPEEAAALYDYAPLFLPEANQAAAEARIDLAEYATWNIDSVRFSSREVNGRTVSVPESIAVSGTIEEGFFGERRDFSFSTDGECFIYEFADESDKICSEETQELAFEELGLTPEAEEMFNRLSTMQTGFTVVERDGRWYASLVPSVIYLYSDVLSVFEPNDIDTLIELQADLVDEIDPMNPFGAESKFVEIDPGFEDPSFSDELIFPEDDAEQQFEDVADAIGGFDELDTSAFDGKIAGTPESAFGMEPDFTFASFMIEGLIPERATAMAVYYEDASLEIVHAPGGFDSALLVDWTSTQSVAGFDVYTDDYGVAFAVVGEYLVLDYFAPGELGADFVAQVELLAAQE